MITDVATVLDGRRDQTVELLDGDGNVLAAVAVELDVAKMIEDFKDQPVALRECIEHYVESKNYSPVSLVLALDAGSLEWHVFEGTCNPKKHTFKILRPIIKFPANKRDPRRPPTQAMDFVSNAAVASGLSVWIP